MTTYNPTQEVQKTCLEIARRVTSIKNFIEFLEREGRFTNSAFVSRDYEAFERDMKERSKKLFDCECFFLTLSNFPYEEELDELTWWDKNCPLIGRRRVGENPFYDLVDTGERGVSVVSFNTLYRSSGLFEVVEKEKFDLPDWEEYENAKTGEPLSIYDIRHLMCIFDTDVLGLVSMGTIKLTSPAQGTRYYYAPNFKKLNELIELHNTLSPLVFKCPVVLEKF